MDIFTRKAFEAYLKKIELLPETRKNISIKECLITVLQEEPDTEESLNDATDKH
jgi:hypothetical protein